MVTGSRADYGLLRPTIRALSSDARFELQLLVAAMHLSEQYGLTVREIDDDGFPIAARIETPDVQARRISDEHSRRQSPGSGRHSPD